ncbi:delta(3,5)-Delta(2,4)-dienoyl-CoA isomerase, mitochondrial-like [Manacus candei]|uniref:delta(3,5)-Delta(2,4)-dienoyl-CoA isomerase, mitochondrial-like n=1 Tax=Manacus candei TaxID=415023 RepID=UPI002227F2EC|nr:delta(3,5)-Delta(2,4)-dienoyl-CoA isomerase, mitochondrial-like [Manacus candei]
MALVVARLLRAPLRVLRRSMASEASEPSGAPGAPPREFQTLRVRQEREHVLHVELNRPGKRNAINLLCWRELVECFQDISRDPSCRAVVVSGAGNAFTSGIDLADLGGLFLGIPGEDVARRAWNLRQKILEFQESFSVLEKCPKPVIAAVHGPCIGAGVDLISACDIRFCSQDASFQVKEVDIGLAADVGTLQRLPKIVGSQSLVNELAFTARRMLAPEALSCGLVSRVLPDKATLLEVALGVAVAIAARSPVAVQGTKINLVYSRDRPTPEGLQHMATWNMAMLQTEDILKSVQAAQEKKGPEEVPFAKL